MQDNVSQNFEESVEKALNLVKNQSKSMSADDVNAVTRFVEGASKVKETISEKVVEFSFNFCYLIIIWGHKSHYSQNFHKLLKIKHYKNMFILFYIMDNTYNRFY